MRTRYVKVRRERPAGVIWCLAALAAGLALFLFAARPVMMRELTRSEPTPAAPEKRVTRDVEFPALSCYLIQLGAYDTREEARVEAAKTVRRGAAGYVLNAQRYLVIGAGYDTREEADRVRENLRQAESMDCAVHALSCAGLALRVTATEEQLAALLGAERALRDGTSALGATALRLDAGETDMSAAASEIHSLREDCREAAERLRVAAGESPNRVARTILDLLDAFDAGVSGALGAETALSFSGKLKYNMIDMRSRHIAALGELSA